MQTIKFNLKSGEVTLFKQFFTSDFYSLLKSQIEWEQKSIKLYGKVHNLPRLTAWHGDSNFVYTYSGIENKPKAWTSLLVEIKTKIEDFTRYEFNTVLLNYYRSGSDSISWHSDNEPELGENPVIASVSFGGSRKFMLKNKMLKDDKVSIDLQDGDLLIMSGKTQEDYLHQIPKTTKFVQPRINLTFRNMLDTTTLQHQP